ncbi:DUF3887 domain-containing protein [Chroococcus sp. FPU101]|uniref:DUF3887 domain-containing protein n=1 Tax=Chroococcus sp. FPU101 TaxID=1974212 RepID=UPI001A8E2051|nr:DUF3887 domain-containing protein [Chroococcus sp. FPU101]GFE71974.1 hypothetical protein CFPU101_45840 [Chroococcus sp. FPU101]
MVIRFSLFMKHLPWTLLLVLIPAFSLPTHAQTPTTTTVQVPLTEAEKATMQERAKTMIELLNRGEYSKARELLAPDFANQITAEEIQSIWGDTINKFGKIKQQVSSQVIDTVNSDLVVIKSQFEQGQGNIIVTFNEDEQIVGVDFPRLESVSEISEILVQSLAKRDFPRARGYLHPLLKTEIFPQQVQQRWDNLQKANGMFKRVVDTDVSSGSSVDESEVVIMTLEFERATQQMLVIFDDQRRIVGINIVE